MVARRKTVSILPLKRIFSTLLRPMRCSTISTLNALPQAQLIDGYIEAVKVALGKDADCFRMIEQQADVVDRNPKAIAQVIQTSARHIFCTLPAMATLSS